jgi:hypothetical protein
MRTRSAFAVAFLCACGSTVADVPRDPDVEPPAAATPPPSSTPPSVAAVAPVAKKRVFITQEKWNGDLRSAALAAGVDAPTGLAAGDALCNVAAASLGGTWRAWLSDSNTNAIDRLHDVGPWHRLDGVTLFANKAALAGDPLAPIDLDETGAPVDYAPWTGTLADGTKSAHTCGDWLSSSSSDYGLCGFDDSATQRKWSEGTIPLCDHAYNLYCFEQ